MNTVEFPHTTPELTEELVLRIATAAGEFSGVSPHDLLQPRTELPARNFRNAQVVAAVIMERATSEATTEDIGLALGYIENPAERAEELLQLATDEYWPGGLLWYAEQIGTKIGIVM